LKYFRSSILNEKSFIHLIFIDISHMYVCRCVIEATVFHMCKENIQKKKIHYAAKKRQKKEKKETVKEKGRKCTSSHVLREVPHRRTSWHEGLRGLG